MDIKKNMEIRRVTITEEEREKQKYKERQERTIKGITIIKVNIMFIICMKTS